MSDHILPIMCDHILPIMSDATCKSEGEMTRLSCHTIPYQCLSADHLAPLVLRICDRYKEYKVLVATDSPDMVSRLKLAQPNITWLHVPADR